MRLGGYRPSSRPRRFDGLWLVNAPFLLFLILPLGALLSRVSVDQLAATLVREEVYRAISLSLTTASMSVLITIVFGTPLAYLMARRTFRLKRVLDTLIDLPTVLPPAVAGVALLLAFGRRGIVGSLLEDWGLSIAFTQTAVVIAQTFIAAPLYIKSALVGFTAVEREFEQSATLDGAGSWAVFRLITVPLAWPALLSGAVLTWARALGEFGATIIFAGNYPGRTQTMPLAIYIGFELDLDVALTLSVILIASSCLVLIVAKGLLQRQPVENGPGD
ncbi:MAG TPA: ABC transporter permease [Anaerolineales bacterium]|nr:ABC transporter permease [Anaerolineales bacterium]